MEMVRVDIEKVGFDRHKMHQTFCSFLPTCFKMRR